MSVILHKTVKDFTVSDFKDMTDMDDDYILTDHYHVWMISTADGEWFENKVNIGLTKYSTSGIW